MKMYLDDMRKPPVGYHLVKNVNEAKDFCMNNRGLITDMSLDHDLGACSDCIHRLLGIEPGSAPLEEVQAQWLHKSQMTQMPNCDHFGTGYTFLCWLEENFEYWPVNKPQVHSANPVGRMRMQQVIDAYYSTRKPAGEHPPSAA